MQKGKRGRAKTYDSDSLMTRSVIGILLIAVGVISLISIVGGIQSTVFTLIKQFMQGAGGGLCLGIPLFFIWGGVLVAFSARRKAPVRPMLLLCLLFLCVLGIFNLLSKVGTATLMERAVRYNNELSTPVADADGYWEVVTAGYHLSSVSGAFGGALGMLTAWPLWTYVGDTIGVVILGAVCLGCALFISRFDIVGALRGYRESSDRRLEERELKKERRAYEKELKKQQQAGREQPPAEDPDDPRRPAFRRKREKETQAAAAAQGVATQVPAAQAPVAAPVGYPAAAFGNVAAYPQGMPMPQAGMPVMMGQQTMFPQPVQQPGPPLYDEMIVPEVPDGSALPAWKLKRAPGKTAKTDGLAAGAQGGGKAAQSRDRDTAKVLEKMEANRRRKEQIQQRIDETYTATPAAETKADALEEARLRQAVAGARRPMTREQVEYANQTAGYRAPARDASAAETDAKPGDPYEAYRKPTASAAQQPAMSGRQLDVPYLKLVKNERRQPADAPKKAADTAKKPYPYPMIELLNLQTQALPDTRELDRANVQKLEKTLESFGIPARVQRVTHGPAVTRFELGLVSSGINVKRIMNIADNIALEMAANGGVRIEVPIPGTNLFGVEVPNKEIVDVSLAEVLTSAEMTKAKSPLSVALGKDIAGRPVICDLAKMPHLLIAGQTGSGKSVCINSIINSLLYRSTPEEVRMIMIDPKVVELQGYNRVPHLLIPVVSDPHKASGALAWAVQEMLDRYHKMQSKGVREIAAYNAKTSGDEPKLPRIVIIIDELSDLMIACKKEVEESIIRLAQLARAAGIHVVVATQRPTVNVITGLIKANIPSRIAFAVSSSIDSRTILDMNGAEKLLGRGDMFYYPTGAKAPLRVQGCYLSDEEISNIVDYIGDNSETDYDESINEIMESPEADEADADADGDEESDLDERLQEAVEMVLTDGQASISMLQRRMKIGYARAGRLIDDMAARGIVSKSAGSKPREVLMSYEQYLQQKDSLLR